MLSFSLCKALPYSLGIYCFAPDLLSTVSNPGSANLCHQTPAKNKLLQVHRLTPNAIRFPQGFPEQTQAPSLLRNAALHFSIAFYDTFLKSNLKA